MENGKLNRLAKTKVFPLILLLNYCLLLRNKKMNTQHILASVDELIQIEQSTDALLMKICKLLQSQVEHFDWVGFYILQPGEQMLILGPFVGKPTEHTHIAIGKGVCGQVAANKHTMIVQDVSQMDNYIACSLDVKSEIVVPILKNGQFVAEIDIDSHSPAPFTRHDQILLETIGEKIQHLF